MCWDRKISSLSLSLFRIFDIFPNGRGPRVQQTRISCVYQANTINTYIARIAIFGRLTRGFVKKKKKTVGQERGRRRGDWFASVAGGRMRPPRGVYDNKTFYSVIRAAVVVHTFCNKRKKKKQKFIAVAAHYHNKRIV